MSEMQSSGTGQQFDWDAGNVDHIALHDVKPQEAEEAFLNDPAHIRSRVINGELRHLLVGETNRGRILSLSFVWRRRIPRIVTAWDATKATKRDYLREKAEYYER